MRLLILHALLPDSRQTTIDHVGCYLRHLPGCEIVFHHLRQPTERLRRLAPIDGIVLNYCFLGHRQVPQLPEIRARYRDLPSFGPIVALPQDDYTRYAILDDWLHELGAAHIFTPLADHRDHLYPQCLATARFHSALTGYVEEDRLARLAPTCRPLRERPIDLGTRVRSHAPYVGRYGQRKGALAEALAARLAGSGLRLDLSTRPEDTLHGERWFDFLASCRFVVGQNGGASLADPDGSIRARVECFVAERPDASFEEVERACFPGLDGLHLMTAPSPRLFEAAATRTCQILVEDDYLDLEPWRHYLPLRQDLSNLDEVTAAMHDLGRAQEIADACYDELIASGRFSYRSFARRVVRTLTGRDPRGAAPSTCRYSNALELRLQEAPRRLGLTLFDAFRRWLQRSPRSDQLAGVAEALRAARSDDWLDGMSPWDLQQLVTWSASRAAADAAFLELVSELRRVGGLDACRAWVEAIAGGALGPEQLQPWSEPELLLGERGT